VRLSVGTPRAVPVFTAPAAILDDSHLMVAVARYDKRVGVPEEDS
jgi:hypothetical protein